MDRDITKLMIGTFSGNGRDDFGRDVGTRRSLLLDTVMQGRKCESHCRLLQMPAEILADIVDLLVYDKPALASLALASSDCCYLARSCQFAEIQFDYSSHAQQLLVHLAKEVLHKTDVATRRFPIGVCIRRVTFASHPECVIAYHQELYHSIFSERANLSVMAISHAMPNLEVLAWKDSFTIDDKFFGGVSRCSARHIKLTRVKIDKAWLMMPPLTPANWPLRSLDLDVQLADFSDIDLVESDANQDSTSTEELDHPISPFFETLFRCCAPTLESLSWEHMDLSRDRSRISLGRSPLSFPHLRYLQFGSIFLRPLAFSSLLSSPLKHLELPTSDLERLAECLVTCDPHVHKLLVHERDSSHGDKNQLDRLIIPILAEGGFDNLRCLSLAWGGDGVSDMTRPHEVHIPETALMTLGTIVSLERLSLRAGNNFGWRNQWLIDHNKLVTLVRDTYPISSSNHIDVEKYYYLQFVGDSERVDARARADLNFDETSAAIDMIEHEQNVVEESEAEAEIWEKAHRNRMLIQAEAYAAVFPALEWILCGQRPMGF
ncbi:hypothetical protein V8C37DRAFT_413727 [Trichoderma ceciliae]